MPLKVCEICGGNEVRQTDNLTPLEKLLPVDYDHHLCSFSSLGDDPELQHFRCQLRLNLQTEEEVLQWQTQFQEHSGFTWRKSKTYPNPGPKNKFRLDLRCHHKTRAKEEPSRKSKNTCCPATLHLVVKNTMFSRGRESRSGDSHFTERLVTVVTLRHEHNHRVACAEALRWNDVSSETVEKITTLFQNGHSPSSALKTLKRDLQAQYGNEYMFAAADRSKCPDAQFCYRLYYKIFRKSSGPTSGQEMVKELELSLEQYNINQGERCAALEIIEDKQFVVAMCTPLMKRVHAQLAQSGEMVFMYSSGSCDKQNHHVYLLLTHYAGGGLPLGVIVTSAETQPAITAGLQLLKTLTPSGSFFGREDHGPQAMWRWLWANSNNINSVDRVPLLNLFQDLIYSSSEASLKAQYAATHSNSLATKYEMFMCHLEEIYQNQEDWAVCLQVDPPMWGNHTNQYVEAAMLVLKDKVLHRLKAYNLTQLVDFVQTRMESYYARRLLDVAKNRRSRKQPKQYSDVAIMQVGEMQYTVTGAAPENEYHVNTALRTCTCPVGEERGSCKHLNAVMTQFDLQDKELPTSPYMRKMLHEIAIGKGVPDDKVLTLELEVDQTNSMESSPTFIDSTWATPIGQDDEEEEDHEQEMEDPGYSSIETILAEELQDLFHSVSNKLLADPEIFTSPVQTFIDSFKSLNTDSALASALCAFGRETGRKPLQSSASGEVQPAEEVQRKAARRGHGAPSLGHPPKRERIEHDYQ
ncbi:uncharacterized protein LOC143002896 isoform X2 [Genypterus blacodes]|uniref:uncharacterized protein LOC143002896 isoform X2 n=1 Tax=Genypterus blacodes TaxID=154954 RepID=UPI003F75F2EF